MIRYSNIQLSETGTPTEPVTTDEVKAWITGLEGVSDFDTMIGTMITSARQDIENFLNVKLVDSTVSLYVDTTNCDDEIVALPYSPSLPGSFTTVNKISRGSDPEAMASGTDYFLNGSLSFLSTGKYQLAYSISGNVPETIKEAIKMLVAYRFANRGDNEKQMGIPEDVVSKIHKYLQQWL